MSQAHIKEEKHKNEKEK